MVRTGCEIYLRGTAFILILIFMASAGCLEPGNSVFGALLPSATVPPPHPPAPLYSFSLIGIQKNLAPDITLALPTYLPDGFFFTTGMQAQPTWEGPASDRIFSFTYSRGQDEFVTLTEQSRNWTTCPDASEYRLADVGKTRTQREGSSELTWGSDGWCFALSSSLPREEMEKIAASVVLVPYRDGVLPPYEYQPLAHPLIGSFTFNRSATAQGITITFETLHCAPEACTAEIRLGVASPPAFSAPPGVTPPPVSPEPHAEWRVDGGRPLLKIPGSGGYRPEGGTTLIFWDLEPLPEDSRNLSVNFSRIKGVSGPWLIVVSLEPVPERTPLATYGREESV